MRKILIAAAFAIPVFLALFFIKGFSAIRSGTVRTETFACDGGLKLVLEVRYDVYNQKTRFESLNFNFGTGLRFSRRIASFALPPEETFPDSRLPVRVSPKAYSREELTKIVDCYAKYKEKMDSFVAATHPSWKGFRSIEYGP